MATEDSPWQPRSVLSILDGLSSIRWAYILLGMGPEPSIHLFFDWLVKLVRSRPQKTDQLGQFWTTTSWKLAMELRGGKAWDEAVQPIMRDYDTSRRSLLPSHQAMTMARQRANIRHDGPPMSSPTHVAMTPATVELLFQQPRQ